MPATPSSSASAAPSPETTSKPVSGYTLSGRIYDENQSPLVSGVRVHVRSLSTSAPFEATLEAADGTYSVTGVPVGVQVAITASKDGWTSRTRVETLIPASEGAQPRTQTVNFGGLAEPGDTSAPVYYLSDYPEIAEIEPAAEARLADNSRLVYTMTLSEALPEVERARFAQSLKVLPANEHAVHRLQTRDLTGPEASDYKLADAPYAIAPTTRFLDLPISLEWDATGRIATLRSGIPLITSQDGEAKYQLVLASTGTAIRDSAGNPLGTDASGARSATALEKGRILHNVFRSPALPSLTLLEGLTAEQRWHATHDTAMGVYIPRDRTPPTLLKVSASRASERVRIRLIFSEPLVVFDGSAEGYALPNYKDLSRYTFAVDKSVAELERANLDGSANLTVDADSRDFGAKSAERSKAFSLSGATLALDEADPTAVVLTLDGGRIFSSEIGAIRARADGIADPAGNVEDDDDADAHVVTGPVD